MNLDSQIVLPPGAAFFLLLQRTQYQRWQRNPLLALASRIIDPASRDSFSRIRLESKMRPRAIAEAYGRELTAEYQELRPYLPESPGTVVDIGCGLAGIDVLLARHYGTTRPNWVLVDSTEVSNDLHYLFEDTGSFYNSLHLAEQVLIRNGISAEHIRLIDVGKGGQLAAPEAAGLVISLISWGFHYPVSVYLSQVLSLLSADGTVILDVRRSTDGERAVRDAFEQVSVLREEPKRLRLAAQSPRRAL